MASIKLVANPKTKPPDPSKPYIPVERDGKEEWLLLYGDTSDGITDADFDFDKGKKWAAEQKRAAEQDKAAERAAK